MGRFDALIGQMGSDNPLRSVADYEGDMLKREQLRMAMGANALTLDERKQKAAEYKRGLAEQEAVRNILAGLGPAASREAQIAALSASGIPTGIKIADEWQKNYDTSRKTDAEVADKKMATTKTRNDIIASVMSRVAQDPSQWQSALGVLEQNGIVDFNWSNKARQMASQATPEAIQQWAQQHFAAGMGAEKLLPKTSTMDTGGYQNLISQDVMSGKLLGGGKAFEKTQSPDNAATNARMAAEGAANRATQVQIAGMPQRAPAPMPTSGPPTKLKPGEIWNEAAGRVDLAPGTPAYLKAKDAHAKDSSGVTQVNNTADVTIKQIDEVLAPENKSGFEANFGGYNALLTQFRPGDDAQKVKLKIESIKSGMKKAGLEMMRQGGSIGQMTVKEWPIVEGMIARIDPKLGEVDARQEFANVKAYLEGMKTRAAETYGREWSGSQFSGASVPKPPNDTGDVPAGIDPKDWAYMTPEDKAKWKKP